MIYTKVFKRCFSVILSFLMLILTSPIMLITAILVRIKLGSPVFFVQERAGYKEKTFKLIKFRTMTDKQDASGNLLPDNERLTKLGCFLRKTSMDELPEMINILKGDMAFVGPRPLLTSYLELYNEEQHKRHNVRPGFTCIAAVKGRNIIPWVERLKLDTYYAEHVTFRLDFWIVLQTVLVVLLRKGAPDAAESSREPIEIALRKENGNEGK